MLNFSYFVLSLKRIKFSVLKILHDSNFSSDSKISGVSLMFYIYLISFLKEGSHIYCFNQKIIMSSWHMIQEQDIRTFF